jgi:hypothetical protein
MGFINETDISYPGQNVEVWVLSKSFGVAKIKDNRIYNEV